MAFKIPSNKGSQYPKDKQGWANFINNLHDSALRERRPDEFNWAMNIAYYLGFQHLRYNPISGELARDIEQLDHFIINRIAPFVETRVAKLTRGKPIPAVTPDQLDPILLKAAELNEHLFRHYWKVQDRDAKERTHAIFMVLMGCAFKKVIWNPVSGEFIERKKVDPEGRVFLNDDGSDEMEKIFMGNIECHIKSPFAVLASPGATKVEEADWIIDRTFMTLEEVQDKFPNINKDNILSTSSGMTQYESFVSRLRSPVFSGLTGFNLNRVESDNHIKESRIILVKEFWKKPSKIYPNGLVAVVAGNELLSMEEWPYEHKQFPFIKTDDKENPFGFYGVSTVTRMIPVQRQYNESRTQVATNAKLMANGKWLVAKGSGLLEDALTDEEGEVIEYNPNLAPPRQAEIAPLPNYVLQSEERALQDLRDISGEREASQLPFQGLTAAIALQEAAAQANEILGPILANLEEGIETEGEQVLQLANQFYSDPRKIKIVGKDNAFIVKIDKTDLLNQTELTITLESGLGETKGSQRQALIDLWDRRIIQDPQQFLKAFELGRIDLITKEEDPAEKLVIEDLEMIKQGKKPVVRPFDNHILFVKKLSQFIQTPEFRRMPEDRQALAMITLQEHLQALQPKQEEGQNQAAVGTPFGSQVTEGA